MHSSAIGYLKMGKWSFFMYLFIYFKERTESLIYFRVTTIYFSRTCPLFVTLKWIQDGISKSPEMSRILLLLSTVVIHFVGDCLALATILPSSVLILRTKYGHPNLSSREHSLWRSYSEYGDLLSNRIPNKIMVEIHKCQESLHSRP